MLVPIVGAEAEFLRSLADAYLFKEFLDLTVDLINALLMLVLEQEKIEEFLIGDVVQSVPDLFLLLVDQARVIAHTMFGVSVDQQELSCGMVYWLRQTLAKPRV